ncbi:MAG: MFS transporter [Promethearchaeota archaeon]
MSSDDITDSQNWKISSTKKMMSYSFGFIITLYVLSAYTAFVFYFYEVEVNLHVQLVSLALILFTVYTIISSPILGYLTDKPFKWSQKWGFRSPWIMFSSIPILIFYILLYTPPNVDAKSNQLLLFCYLFIISCLFGTFLAIFRQHFEGSFANQFREDFERRRASALAFIFPGIVLFLLNLLPLLIIKYGDRSSFVLTAIVSATVMGVCLLFLIPGIRESTEAKMRYMRGYEDTDRISFLQMMKVSLKQRNFTVSLISSTLVNFAATLNMASGIYFFKDVLGLPIIYSIYPTIAFYIAVMASLPFWISFAAKHGILKTYILGVFLSALAYIPYLWITTLEETIIYAIARGIGYSCFSVMVLPLIADCYDEVTLACGKHQEATLLGIRTIFMRSSVIFQALIIGSIHIFTGYNPDPEATQNTQAVWGIRIHQAFIPMIFCFMATLVMLLWFDLVGEKKMAMRAKMRELGL